jgi:hypothetical protein
MPPPPAASIRLSHQLKSADQLLAHEIERLHIGRLHVLVGRYDVWVAEEAIHKTHVVLAQVDAPVALEKMMSPASRDLSPIQKSGSNKIYSPCVEVDI